MVATPHGIAAGVRGRRGFPVTKLKKPEKKIRQSKKNIFARDLIEEIAGLAPYELRLVDMMEISEKRSQRFVKKRLGSMRRAKRKLRKLEELKRKIRRREADKKAEADAKQSK